MHRYTHTRTPSFSPGQPSRTKKFEHIIISTHQYLATFSGLWWCQLLSPDLTEMLVLTCVPVIRSTKVKTQLPCPGPKEPITNPITTFQQASSQWPLWAKMSPNSGKEDLDSHPFGQKSVRWSHSVPLNPGLYHVILGDTCLEPLRFQFLRKKGRYQEKTSTHCLRCLLCTSKLFEV